MAGHITIQVLGHGVPPAYPPSYLPFQHDMLALPHISPTPPATLYLTPPYLILLPCFLFLTFHSTILLLPHTHFCFLLPALPSFARAFSLPFRFCVHLFTILLPYCTRPLTPCTYTYHYVWLHAFLQHPFIFFFSVFVSGIGTVGVPVQTWAAGGFGGMDRVYCWFIAAVPPTSPTPPHHYSETFSQFLTRTCGLRCCARLLNHLPPYPTTTHPIAMVLFYYCIDMVVDTVLPHGRLCCFRFYFWFQFVITLAGLDCVTVPRVPGILVLLVLFSFLLPYWRTFFGLPFYLPHFTGRFKHCYVSLL